MLALLAWRSIDRASGDTRSDGDGLAADTSQAAATLLPGSTMPRADPAGAGAEASLGATNARAVAPVSQEWSLSSAEIDPRAAELDIAIIVVMPDEIVEYDTGNGERASFQLPTFTARPPAIEAGQDWIRLQNLELNRTDLYQDRDRPERLPGDLTFRQPGTDLFWAIRDWKQPNPNRPLSVHEIDRAGDETGVSFDVGPIVAADPAGGVVVRAPGGTYQVGPDGSRRITTGDLIALNAQTALVADCGDQYDLSCELAVLDRVTGDSRPLTLVLTESVYATNPYQTTFAGAISPDSRYAPLLVNGSEQPLGVIDLTTGAITDLTASLQSAMWWSPDSNRVIYMRDDRLLMYDFDQGTELAIVPDSDGLRSFAVRT